MSPKAPSKLGLWLAIAASCLGFLAYLWLRAAYLHKQGQDVFWLAELFSPVAFFSVLLVTFVEKLVRPPRPVSRKKR